MNRYFMIFSKTGYIKYISHLDMLRLFKRAFKRTGIALEFSHGFNPHPKMGFAQPLSLGYTSLGEYLEFETVEAYDTEDLKKRMQDVLPEGMVISRCSRIEENIKSLASLVDACTFKVTFPVRKDSADFDSMLSRYLAQDSIMALKRQKKTKKMKEVDIRGKIRSVRILPDELLTLEMNLDSGSNSNLSPEQVISSFNKFAGLNISRAEIEVERTGFEFLNHPVF